MIRRTGCFSASDDAGNQHKISVMIDFIPTDNPPGEVAGVKTFLTEMGQNVSRVKAGVFEVAGTKSILRSNHRLAK